MTYDISFYESRSRVTNAFRLILALPHQIVVAAWGYLVHLLSAVQWFIVVLTGRRNRALWDLQRAWLGYAGRVTGYTNLMFDAFPSFGTAPGRAPVSVDPAFEERADRLTNGLRVIWVIPALLLAIVLGVALGVVVAISWFAIVITGRHPRRLFEFSLRVLRFALQLSAYVLLMTDAYPRWVSAATARRAMPGTSTLEAPAADVTLPPPSPLT